MGGKLSDLKFIRLELNARMIIDKYSFNKLHKLETDDPIWEKVRFLVLELIERGYMGRLDGRDRTSESNDGTSISYEAREGRAEKLIRDYLPSLVAQGITTARIVKG
jgi:hypothetical protein